MLLLNHGSLWIVDRCFFFRIQKTEAGVLWDVHCLSEKELKMCREKHVMLFFIRTVLLINEGYCSCSCEKGKSQLDYLHAKHEHTPCTRLQKLSEIR